MHFIYISCNLKNYTHSLIVRSAEIIAFVGYVIDIADVVICVFFVICFCACLLVVCYNMIIIVCGEGILSNLVRNNVSNKTTSIIEQHHRGIYTKAERSERCKTHISCINKFKTTI